MAHPTTSTYIGRFAPSPSGKLHHGSLVTAVASYLDARHHRGQWLLRMEDLDPPREEAGAADAILRTLEAHHLFWDGPVLYQSQRQEAYRGALEQLTQKQLIYRCNCSRQRLLSLPYYDGHCLRHPPKQRPWAMRLMVPRSDEAIIEFYDLFQGHQCQDLRTQPGDFVVQRKDGLFAYQLAVVVDDIEQRVNHIIRGSDLLDSSLRQGYLFQQLQSSLPTLGHLPVLINASGQKLSKQNHAEPVNNQFAAQNLLYALSHLQLTPPAAIRQASCTEILDWAVTHWSRETIPNKLQIEVGNLSAS